MKTAALGQYYPSDSVIHRLDGRMKLILMVIFIVACFLCKSFVSFVLLICATAVLVVVSKVPFSVIFKGLKAIVFILIFTFVINMFFTKGEKPLVSWWIIELYPEGIWNAAFMSLRILILIIGTTLFVSYTTTPIQLTDALERLLYPLKYIGVPVSDFAMMMSIALRFIPTLSEETDKIMTAQKARGADFSTGSLISRISSLIPVLVPLFVSAFRRAEELATAMECRCYHGGRGRTRLHVSVMGLWDFIALGFMIVLIVGIIVLNGFSFVFTL